LERLFLAAYAKVEEELVPETRVDKVVKVIVVPKKIVNVVVK
jgi:hypothetical protein